MAHLLLLFFFLEDMKRTALTSSFQLLAHADDIALIARRLPDLKEFFIRLSTRGKPTTWSFQGVHAQHSQDRTLRSAITTSSVLVPTTIWKNLWRRPTTRHQQLGRESWKGTDVFTGCTTSFDLATSQQTQKSNSTKSTLRAVITFGLETCTLTAKLEEALEIFKQKFWEEFMDNGQWRKLFNLNHEIKQIYRLTNYRILKCAETTVKKRDCAGIQRRST